MIIEYKNSDGYIYAYISWNVIDHDNKLGDNKEIVSVCGTWIHSSYENLGVLKRLIKDLFYHPTTQKSLYVLSYREKYKGRPPKLKPIYRYLKYIGGTNGKFNNNNFRKDRSRTNRRRERVK